jgi:creatinine amidohydrolase
MIENIIATWNATPSTLQVVARGINMVEGVSIPPDHAGVFETTVLSALWPDRVDLSELAPLDPTVPSTADSSDTDDFDDSRHDPKHPLWGVFGPDPRNFDPSQSEQLLVSISNWIAAVGP